MKSNYSVLAGVTAGLNGLALALAAGLYYLRPELLQSLVQAEVLAGASLLILLYFASIHQLVKKRWLEASVGAMAALSAANLGFLVVQTGGLDSPFYAFWLLGVVAAGLFGTWYVLALLTVTTAGTIWAFAQAQFAVSYMTPKLGTLLITAFAAGLAEWIHYNFRQPAKIPITQPVPKPIGKSVATDVLMSRMADGVVVVDGKGIVRMMNRAAEELTGWDAASAVGLDYHSVFDLKTADDQPAGNEHDPFYRSNLSRQSLVASDLFLYARNGHKIALSVSVAPISDSSVAAGSVAVLRDISKEKEVERQRSEFISTASHEMRTPVAAIEGYISLAMNPKVATVDTRAMEYLSKAHDNTKHLGALFRDLLSVTKLEEGLKATQLVPVNLSELIKEVIDEMQLTAEKKGLSITYASGAAGGDRSVMPIYHVLAEPERLREVMVNLIENAIKFTSEGGITIGVSADPKIVTVRIADTGPGISPENIKHLFQKFYRVDNSATRTIGGTGLGLYLARSIIELFNGRIWVESQVGKGSSFNFSLVRTQPQPTAAPAIVRPTTVNNPPKPSSASAVVDGLRPAPIPVGQTILPVTAGKTV